VTVMVVVTVMVPTTPVPTVMVVPTPPMPAMVMVTVPMPAHLRGHLLPDIVLHRCCRTRIDQRGCPCTLDRCRDQKEGADNRQAQNFRSFHSNSPSTMSRERYAAAAALASPRRPSNPGRGDVNDD